MGAQIAQVLVLKGYSVLAYDVSEAQLARGLELIRSGRYGLDSSVERGRISKEERESALSKIKTTLSLDEALRASDVVLEVAIEDLSTKKEIFRRAAELSGEKTILASNTSTLSISKITSDLGRARQRCVGIHFFNPPQVMKLVEIVRTDQTSDDVVRRASDLARRIEKTPIVVKDVPGFVANRIGLAVFAEASSLLEKGVSTVREIDLAMRLGYGYPLGPFELGDLVGLDSRLRNMEAIFDETGDERFRPPEILRKLVSEGYLGDPKTRKGSKGGYYEYFNLKRPGE